MKLEEYDAQVEYLKQSFTDAALTEVEIAVIYVDIPRRRLDSLILTDLQKPGNECTNFAENDRR